MKFNKSFRILFTLLVLIGLAFTVAAAPPPLSGWGTGGQGAKATEDWAVASANSASGGAPIVSYMSVTGDQSTNILKIYNCYQVGIVTNTYLATNAVAGGGATKWAGTNFLILSGATNMSLAAGDYIVVQTPSTDSYWMAGVHDLGGTTNHIQATNIFNGSTPLTNGCIVWKASWVSKIVVAAATKEINAGSGFFWIGRPSAPTLFHAYGGAACSINCISGSYAK
jgi:hypothetical protein